jgi:predicted alternative tryptophan synthase beta-subunit
MGQQGVTAIEIAKQIAQGNIKVTPDFLVQGGDNLGGLLSAFLTNIIAGKDQVALMTSSGESSPAGKEE